VLGVGCRGPAPGHGGVTVVEPLEDGLSLAGIAGGVRRGFDVPVSDIETNKTGWTVGMPPPNPSPIRKHELLLRLARDDQEKNHPSIRLSHSQFLA